MIRYLIFFNTQVEFCWLIDLFIGKWGCMDPVAEVALATYLWDELRNELDEIGEHSISINICINQLKYFVCINQLINLYQ